MERMIIDDAEFVEVTRIDFVPVYRGRFNEIAPKKRVTKNWLTRMVSACYNVVKGGIRR